MGLRFAFTKRRAVRDEERAQSHGRAVMRHKRALRTQSGVQGATSGGLVPDGRATALAEQTFE